MIDTHPARSESRSYAHGCACPACGCTEPQEIVQWGTGPAFWQVRECPHCGHVYRYGKKEKNG